MLAASEGAAPTLAERLVRWRALLDAVPGQPPLPSRRTPVGQLVKSLISSRTTDAVSLAAFAALRERFGNAAGIAAATAGEIEAAIAEVTFADVKAERLVAALRMIAVDRPDLDLRFLRDKPMAEALAWLERLPGVGRKTAASVMNFTTIDRPVLVTDSHVARVLGRLGIGTHDAMAASERVTAAMADGTPEAFRRLHAQLKRLGQTLCRRERPHCGGCPLNRACAHAAEAAVLCG